MKINITMARTKIKMMTKTKTNIPMTRKNQPMTKINIKMTRKGFKINTFEAPFAGKAT